MEGAEYSKYLHARSSCSGFYFFLTNSSQRDTKCSLLYNQYNKGKAVRMCPPPPPTHSACQASFLGGGRGCCWGCSCCDKWVRNSNTALLNPIPGWHLAVLDAFFTLQTFYLVRKSNWIQNAFV